MRKCKLRNGIWEWQDMLERWKCGKDVWREEIDWKLSKKGRRTKKRGGEGMEDLEMAKTEQWKNYEMGEYKKDQGPKAGWIEETEERWINNKANQEEWLGPLWNEIINMWSWGISQWRAMMRNKQGVGGKKGMKDNKEFWAQPLVLPLPLFRFLHSHSLNVSHFVSSRSIAPSLYLFLFKRSLLSLSLSLTLSVIYKYSSSLFHALYLSESHVS